MVVDEATFNARAAARAGMSIEDYDKATESYKSKIASTIQRGGSVAMHGEGTYSSSRVAARIGMNRRTGNLERFPAYRKIKYKGYGDGNKQKLNFDQAIIDKVNNR